MSDEEKSLPASVRKKMELRKKGQVPRSQDVNTVGGVVAGFIALLVMGPIMAVQVSGYMTEVARSLADPSPSALMNALMPVNLMWYLAGTMLIVLIGTVSIQFAQIGVVIPENFLEPKLQKLSPVNGVKQLFSMKRLVQTGFSILKLIVVSAFGYLAARALLDSPVFVRPVTPWELAAFFPEVLWAVGWRVLLAAAILAGLDYAYQRWQFEKDNRMSVKEAKDEVKSSEGSPEMKAKRRALARRKSIRRILEDVSDSTIVITNPTHYAVALRYVQGETAAPVIKAMGMRRIALRIKQRAKDHMIPVIESPPLARGLYKHGNIGAEIPELYYQAVAGVLAQLYRRGYEAIDEDGLEEDGSQPPEQHWG